MISLECWCFLWCFELIPTYFCYSLLTCHLDSILMIGFKVKKRLADFSLLEVQHKTDLPLGNWIAHKFNLWHSQKRRLENERKFRSSSVRLGASASQAKRALREPVQSQESRQRKAVEISRSSKEKVKTVCCKVDGEFENNWYGLWWRKEKTRWNFEKVTGRRTPYLNLPIRVGSLYPSSNKHH